MNSNLSCDIIRDLLPSYIDGIASEETNSAVKEHTQTCESCRESLELMSAPEEKADVKERKEINFLKSVKKKIEKIVLIAVAAALLCAVGFSVKSRVESYIEDYVVEVPLSASDLEYEIRIDGKKMMLSGNIKDSSRGRSGVTYSEKNGVVTVNMNSTCASEDNWNQFVELYDASTDIKQIYIGDMIVWENGVLISEEAVRLYDTKHPYIGDMGSNEKSASAMKVVQTLGYFLNELHTRAEPYGWTLFMENSYAEENADYVERKMRHYGYLLIATIGNLDYVTFDYTVGSEKRTLTVNEAQADELYGSSVKEAAGTYAGVQKLIDTL